MILAVGNRRSVSIKNAELHEGQKKINVMG
jgi:hypothetical protein